MSEHMNTLACRFHPDAELVEDHRAGDMICPVCGLVVGDRMIDVSSEWRTFGDDSGSKDRSRVGAAESHLSLGQDLETAMSIGTGPGALDDSGKQKYSKKHRTMTPTDKALRSGFDCIRQMASRIGLSRRVVDHALALFKKCYENKCVRGRSNESVAAACIYIACRREGAQRTIKEICAISETASKKEIGRCFSLIIKRVPNLARPESIEIKNLVPRFCSRLNLVHEIHIRKAAVHIAERANELCDIQSRGPDSIAGAAIYMACAAAGERQAIGNIQEAVGVMQNTIRLIYRIMLRQAAALFPADFSFKCPVSELPTS